MLRKPFAKKRQTDFNLTQRANDILLPAYNALKDPFLIGYFDNPLVKKHLKQTGVLKKKKRFSINKFKLLNKEGSNKEDEHSKSHNITSRSLNKLQNHIKLSQLQQILAQDRNLTSSKTTRVKHMYKSNNLVQQM